MTIAKHLSARLAAGTTAAVLVLGLVLSSLPALAANETLPGVTDKSATVNEVIAIDDLTIDGDGNDEITLNIYVSDGLLEFGDTTGLDGQVLGSNLTFSGTREDINAALATLTYTNDRGGEFEVQATVVTGEGEVYNPLNQHVYQVVAAGGEGIEWNDARLAAEAMEYGGAAGYLVTITSEEENNFVASRLSDEGWMGASDSDDFSTEGSWEWVGGPEAGVKFWDTENGVAENTFVNWDEGQPDDYNEGEDCGQIVLGSSGAWNDLPCFYDLPYYVVEFGDDETDPEISSVQFNITVTGETVEIDSCEELQAVDEGATSVYNIITLTGDIDCEGQTIEPLYPGASFQGSIVGNNHTIRNLVIEGDPGSPIGLIATAINPTINGLTLENVEVTGGDEIAALIGTVSAGIDLQNVHIKNAAIVSSTGSMVGTLIGELNADDDEYSRLFGVTATGSLTVESDEFSYIGGLVGKVRALDSSLQLRVLHADVDIYVGGGEEASGSDIGGLFGELEAGGSLFNHDTSVEVLGAYAWGDVYAPQASIVGGLIGRVDIAAESPAASSISISQTYAWGHTTGNYSVGGLLGQLDDSAFDDEQPYEVTASFAMGKITVMDDETEERGGLFGSLEYEYSLGNELTSSDNYFDQTRTGESACNFGFEVTGCTAVNTDGNDNGYFINNETSPPLDQWNFEDDWLAQPGTPPVFTPLATNPETDEDQDGVLDSIENSAPNFGDANGDGTQDSSQAYVASFVSSVTNKYVVLETTDDCDISSAAMQAEASGAKKDSGYNYPHGLMNFTLECYEPGFTATVAQYYYDTTPDGFVLRKHLPASGAYFNVPEVALTAGKFLGEDVIIAQYSLKDGESLDIDGQENGTIVDPTGLGAAAVGSPNTGLGGRQ